MPMVKTGLLIGCAVLLAACGGGGEGSSSAFTISVAGGEGQTGAAGNPLPNPIEVEVRDADGDPASVTVDWAVLSGGGSLGAASSSTDGSGIASTTWALGSVAGTQSIRATVRGSLPAASLTIEATATSGGPPLSNTIEVVNNRFEPSTLTVAVGTAVLFSWPSGSTNHNVVPWTSNVSAVPASPGQPALLDGPTSFSVTFTVAATYRFFCSAHGSVNAAGQLSGMAGSITVQ
jgi:plastocyanin